MSALLTRIGLLVALAGANATGAPAAGLPCTVDRATGTTIDPRPLLPGGYGVRWSAAADRLAFVHPDPSGYYRVFTSLPDGSDRVPLLAPGVAPEYGHQGAVYWHPSGRFLLFVAQKADWRGRRLFGVPDYEALPGFGRHDDLWLATNDGRHSWRLTDIPNTSDEGVLIPVFDPSGKRIAWSARQPGGTYALTIADFVAEPTPHLDHIRTYRPGGPAYYETGSFSSDGTRLFYSSEQDTHSFWHSQIYSLDLESGRSTRLTQGNDYNEHPTVVRAPSGGYLHEHERRLAAAMAPFARHRLVCDAGGRDRSQALDDDESDRPDPENTGAMQVAGTVAMSPSGTFMIGDIQDNLAKQTGNARIVRFTCTGER